MKLPHYGGQLIYVRVYQNWAACLDSIGLGRVQATALYGPGQLKASSKPEALKPWEAFERQSREKQELT